MRKFLVINYLTIHQNVFESSCQRAWDTSKGGWPFGAAKTRVLRRTQHLWIEGKTMYYGKNVSLSLGDSCAAKELFLASCLPKWKTWPRDSPY